MRQRYYEATISPGSRPSRRRALPGYAPIMNGSGMKKKPTPPTPDDKTVLRLVNGRLKAVPRDGPATLPGG